MAFICISGDTILRHTGRFLAELYNEPYFADLTRERIEDTLAGELNEILRLIQEEAAAQ
ncbi:MAG: hypothetical protein PHS44_04210 [Candidatus Dojkabacteria bacterium]|nr:hypothetical protein [Candidatus Dojkabacteria bacterium]